MKKWIKVTSAVIITASIVGFYWLGEKINHHNQSTANGSSDYMIILGAKVKPNGDPSLALKARLDSALPYIEQHEHVCVVLSGGKGADEPQSEASVMLAYLKERGIDRKRLIVEDRSTSTYENLQFSQALLPENVRKITIVTNDFHLARAELLAARLGIQTDTIAAPTPKSVEWKLNIRERLALMKAYVMGY